MAFSALADSYAGRFETPKEMGLEEYLIACRDDPKTYASAAERMLDAIGEPTSVDTSRDARLGRIFMNRTIRIYPSFSDFYGMEDAIERVVSFFRHAAQGLEERKQVLYLLGPVGGGKSSLAERLKALMEKRPIFVLKAGAEISPVFESPLGLFDPDEHGETLSSDYGIPRRYLGTTMSPWALKRLTEFGNDISKFTVVRLMPSRLKQIAISKTEPGDDNNQDISTLVGAVDIRKLERFSQNDPDCYGWGGTLNKANQGILEMIEMFKAPIKLLHPLLTATQEGNYVGTQNFGAIPFQGVVIAHSNEAEWQTFRNNKTNEAFLDRVCIVKVPYCLRVTEMQKVFKKLLDVSTLRDANCAPGTLEMLARLSVLSALKTHQNSTPYAKMRVYDGESVRETDLRAKSMQEYRDEAGQDEGMEGLSTRFLYKVLSRTFNHGSEIAADPVHLMLVLERAILEEQLPKDTGAALPPVHQGRPRDALRGVHRQGDPEGLPGELQGLRPEHVRPLHRVCGRLDRGRRLQESRDGADARPRVPERGTDEDREGRGARQSEGLPARDGEDGPPRTCEGRRRQSVVDGQRAHARGHRGPDVLAGGRASAGDQLRHQEGRRDPSEARGVRRQDGRARLHREPGQTPGGVVYAREVRRVTTGVRVDGIPVTMETA